jgi:predicted nucleic acid-binding protein
MRLSAALSSNRSNAAAGERLVTDAKVLQEILHRYTAIDRREAVVRAMRLTLDIVDEVFPIEKADVLRASEITQNRAQMSARDSVHLAVMERHGIRSILSFDSDFDRWPGMGRALGLEATVVRAPLDLAR